MQWTISRVAGKIKNEIDNLVAGEDRSPFLDTRLRRQRNGV